MINGEPTDPTGVDMEMDSCQMINDTMLMGPLLKAMNISATCPIQPVNRFLFVLNLMNRQFLIRLLMN